MPQGSVLGPILFTIYTTSLGSLFRSHNMNYQLYSYDSQTYVIFKPTEQAAAVQRMKTCLASVRKWMCHKSLKLNDKKTEMLLISTKELATKLFALHWLPVCQRIKLKVLVGGKRQTPGYLRKQPCHLPEETGVQLRCAACYDIWCRDLDTDQTITEQTCGRTDQNGKKYAQHHIQR